MHKKVKYNKIDYIEAFEKALIENSRCSAKIYNDYSNAICFRYDDISGVVTLIFHITNCKDEAEIALLFEKNITRNRIISAYFREVKNADARVLMRIYMMERFLERVANSEYRDNFIIKGGMLVTAMVGVALRSTMDIDTSIRNQNLSAADAQGIIENITAVDLGDGVRFEIKDISDIMDEMEYPGMKLRLKK